MSTVSLTKNEVAFYLILSGGEGEEHCFWTHSAFHGSSACCSHSLTSILGLSIHQQHKTIVFVMCVRKSKLCARRKVSNKMFYSMQLLQCFITVKQSCHLWRQRWLLWQFMSVISHHPCVHLCLHAALSFTESLLSTSYWETHGVKGIDCRLWKP